VEAEDGKIWLNHNLGANYTNIRNASFNIGAIPTSELDAHAFGSQFQWGRRADGHELNSYSYNNSTLTAQSSNRAFTQTHAHTHSATDNANFLSADRLPWTVDVFHKNNPSQEPHEGSAVAQFNWQYPTRWNDQWQATETGGDANPCPEGFRVPSESDWNAWDANVTPNVLDPWENSLNSALHLTFTGYRGGTEPGSYNDFGSYWSSTFHSRTSSSINPYGSTSTPAMYRLRRNDSPTHPAKYYHSNVEHEAVNSWMFQGFSVRCIQSSASTSPIPSSMNIITDDQIKYIASINDNDYLPFSIPTTEANQQVSGDGSADDNLIDIQGILTTTGQTFSIPYTSTGSPSYPGYEWTVEVHDSLTEDSQGRTVSFSYPAATATNTGEIIVTVKAIGGNLNLKKLDLANGLGNGTSTNGNISSAYGIQIAEAPITIDDMGTVKYFQLRNISGIPDKMFGQASADGGINEHDFLYIPVEGEDNQIWLNNNLGASYADIHSSSFNIAQQMKTTNDKAAKGSLFQWGRKPDGHELTNRTITQEVTIHSYTFQRNNNPNHSLVIKATNNPYDWRTSTDNNLWNGVNSPNNPCPEGFRVPTSSELSGYFSNAGIIDSTTNKVSALKFPYAGFAVDGYSSSTISSNGGTVGYYWSTNYGTDFGQSTPEPRAYCWQFVPNSNWKRIFLERKGYSMSVRCILD